MLNLYANESIKNENSLKYLTESYAIFDLLLIILPDISVNSNLNNYDIFLLFLKKLKLVITFSILGVLFNIYCIIASRTFFQFTLYFVYKN